MCIYVFFLIRLKEREREKKLYSASVRFINPICQSSFSFRLSINAHIYLLEKRKRKRKEKRIYL